MRIDGREIAGKILEDLKKQTEKLKVKNITPHLAIILVGNDPSSIAYINQKELRAENAGIQTSVYNLKSTITNQELIKLINKLNADKNVHGVIVQRPLPAQISADEIAKAVDPQKDVDGFNPASQFEMPIALAVLRILEKVCRTKSEAQSTKSDFIGWLKTNNVAIMGKGETGGKPIINALKKIGINPTVIDSSTISPELKTQNADIIICAVGKPNVLKLNMIKRGVALISIGISRGESAKLAGDYDQNEVKDIASFYTPTPGGVGPVNVAMLLKNLVTAAENQTQNN